MDHQTQLKLKRKLIMKYAHTNIVTKNWKALSKFYIELFNCTVKLPKRKFSEYWLDQATGLTNAQLEGVRLLLPGHGENGPTLEIFSYKEMASTEPFMANHIGFPHIAFQVDDVNVTFDKALENGASALGKVVEKKVGGGWSVNICIFQGS